MTTSATTRQLQAKSFDVPDETRAMGSKGQLQVIHLDGSMAARATFQPGFHWTEHVKPLAGTDLCQVRHVGYVVSGRAIVRMADGQERELAAGDAFDVPPDHDAWVIGDEPYITVDFAPEKGAPAATAEEMAALPARHQLLLENERVRVLEMLVKPGEDTGMHFHLPCVVYALSSARVRMSSRDGTSRVVETQQGETMWSEGGWHSVENIGETDDWGIIMELKG